MSEPAETSPTPEARYADAIERLAINASRIADIASNLSILNCRELAAEIIEIHRPLLAAGVADVRAAAEAMGVGEPAPDPS